MISKAILTNNKKSNHNWYQF